MRWEKVSRCRCVIIWSREKEGWNKESCINIWQFHFFFLLLSRHLQVAQLVWASEPIVFGSAFVSIYGKASIMRFVSDDQKSGKFQTQSGHSDGRCSCSVYTWFYAQKADYPYGLHLCVIVDYIDKTAWVLRCLFNCVRYSRTSDRGTGKCQVPRSFIYRFTIIN